MWKSLNRGMSTRCGKQKLRGLYQVLKFPAMTARETRRITDFRTVNSLRSRGTDGDSRVYPFWVISQDFS
jgi:hypothetical protein